jgi:ketosteroid isomerase-like protein
MTDTEAQVLLLGQAWAEAERHGDADALTALTTDDFTLVGPLGFVLTKPEWLDRYRSGTLRFENLDWDEITVRSYGDAAIAVGRQTQLAYYQGQPNPGQFRATHVAVQHDGRWLLASMHISQIATPPKALSTSA